MTSKAGWLLVNEVVPMLRSAVPLVAKSKQQKALTKGRNRLVVQFAPHCLHEQDKRADMN